MMIIWLIDLMQGQRFDGELHIVHYNTKYRRVSFILELIVANILTFMNNQFDTKYKSIKTHLLNEGPVLQEKHKDLQLKTYFSSLNMLWTRQMGLLCWLFFYRQRRTLLKYFSVPVL